MEDDGVCFVKCDVTVKEAWPELWDSAEKLLDGPIGILINNAGLFPQVPKVNVGVTPHINQSLWYSRVFLNFEKFLHSFFVSTLNVLIF